MQLFGLYSAVPEWRADGSSGATANGSIGAFKVKVSLNPAGYRWGMHIQDYSRENQY